MEFSSALEAVRCAIEIQKTLVEYNASALPERRIQLRIGIHEGDIMPHEQDVYGDTVNIASRIESLAEPGGICVSQTVYAEVKNKLGTPLVSLGAQRLKNIEEPLEVYRLALPWEEGERLQLFKHLLDRHVPQILVVYFGVSWVVKQFVEWLVNHYPLSPNLPDFSLTALASMIPTVLLLAYFHGKSGLAPWTRFEKIGVPANLLAAVVLLFFFFKGEDLGATTKTVTLQDEEGNTIERVIPKSEFRKRIALFYFDNASGDSTLNWLQYGIVLALDSDLSQDLFLDTGSNFGKKYKEAGFPEGVGLPFTLRKKIADDRHLNYFISGSVARDNEEFSVKTSLYETRRGKLLAERTFTGKDIFQLIDEMSVQLKHDLGLPDYHIEEVEDLRVSEVLTNSMSAFRLFGSGLFYWELKNDWEAAKKYLEEAVNEDPTFAYAHFFLALVYLVSNQSDQAEKAMQAVIQHIHKLPEKDQFEVKGVYYQIFKQDPDKAFRLAKMKVELYPQDIEGHESLARLYLNNDQKDEAISEYKQILKLDPGQVEYLQRIGSIYQEKAEFEEAMKYYKQYAEKFPNKYESFTKIGELYKTLGDYEQAKFYYEKAHLIEPGEIYVLRRLANIESNTGHFEQAIEQYEEALKNSKTPQDSSAVYGYLKNLYELRGQLGKAIDNMHLSWAIGEKFETPLELLIYKLRSLDTYIKAGKQDLAFQVIEEVERQLQCQRALKVYHSEAL